MSINRHWSAQWLGGIKDGKGAISTDSDAMKAYPYGFASRFAAQHAGFRSQDRSRACQRYR